MIIVVALLLEARSLKVVANHSARRTIISRPVQHVVVAARRLLESRRLLATKSTIQSASRVRSVCTRSATRRSVQRTTRTIVVRVSASCFQSNFLKKSARRVFVVNNANAIIFFMSCSFNELLIVWNLRFVIKFNPISTFTICELRPKHQNKRPQQKPQKNSAARPNRTQTHTSTKFSCVWKNEC